ncbi:unnamed protein product [Symbiodinium sp. CCMP2456]|nr:unnamed protein product [Symbiodinium sp. CCMP2456]
MNQTRLRDEYARREGRAIVLDDHDNFTLPAAGHRRSHPVGLKITVTRKSHVAKIKDEFRTAQLSRGGLEIKSLIARRVEEPGQIFSAAETVEPRRITGSVGSFHSKRRREERCLRAVPGKGRFRLVPWQMTRPLLRP